MQKINSDITIIGGGLSGLCIAYYLRSSKLKVHILEARSQLGGRIKTNYVAGQASLEMGATWLTEQHIALFQLLEELGLETYEQKHGDKAIYEPTSSGVPQLVSLPPNASPSYRIKGGTASLIHSLLDTLEASDIYLNNVAKSIEEIPSKLRLIGDDIEFLSSIIISTLPPNLLFSTIAINAVLPPELLKVAEGTHTWMGESIKIGFRYKNPLWRSANLSGTIFSNVGPISEMYDHSDSTDKYYALKGFLNPSYYTLSKEERLTMVLTQLEKYYGKEALSYLSYEETLWQNEPYTYNAYKNPVLPHDNNGHSYYQSSYLNNRLIIGGSETALDFPGYMEGAIRRAKFICNQLQGLI